MKINPSTAEDFRKIIKYLINTNRRFHSFKDPANKNFSVVFKNVHLSLTDSEIMQDLKQRYPSIVKITRLQKDSHPIPVIAAEFNGNESLETILSINQICNLKVTTERRKDQKAHYSVTDVWTLDTLEIIATTKLIVQYALVITIR